MSRRTSLSFSTFDDIADDVRRLRAGACERCGQWSLSQVCHHLNESLQFAMRPGPFPPNTPEQDASTPRFEQVLASGRLPDGIPAPEKMVPPPDAGEAAVDAFLVTLRRYEQFDGPLAPHRIFGHRSRDELRRLVRVHCAHHLSHLVPRRGDDDGRRRRHERIAMFSKILIANRGEIALRVIRACRELGVQTAVVYSTADADAAYLKLADQAICIGGAPANESYLKIDRIIAAAEIADVEAIHPGYGFLSEKAHFADVCRACKIQFIGPSPEAMAAVGDKVACKRLAKKAKVPTVPGSEGAVEDEKEALKIAQQIGYPVIIKAAAGGGGRGMRLAHNDVSLQAGFRQAQAEAEAAFKDSTVYIEKYVEYGRHVEVQVIADHHGNAVHLWERDCSMQRRHQKLVEESPSPALNSKVREALCASAVRLVKAANYTNAGTVEFLVDKDLNYYLLEVNARIQVEHPVTEQVTGIDLIKQQILIAAGEKLPFKQDDIRQTGHAIECRINAEDPSRNFAPSPGEIKELRLPGGPGVRFDSHVYAGYRIPPNYDSMIGKLIVHRPTRAEAIATMKRALSEFHIAPVKTTIPLQLQIMENPNFISGDVDTGFVERSMLSK